jgi:hypothetical protein
MTDIYSLDTPYISIYDKKRGRPNIYTDEEIKQKQKRDNAAKYYDEHYEYLKLKNRIQAKIKYDTKKSKGTD